MSEDTPRCGGLPLEPSDPPWWYSIPDGYDYCDDFEFPESGTVGISLLRDLSTGGLVVEIQHGEHGEHFLRLPLDVPAGLITFGELAEAAEIAEGVSR